MISTEHDTATPAPRQAKDWVLILARYREPSVRRSIWELAATLVPFFALWALAWAAMSVSLWLTFAISSVNALFLVRLFCIQHDCGHASFFPNRTAQDWVGRFLGVLTLTPYDVWRRTHSIHHAQHGNLDQRDHLVWWAATVLADLPADIHHRGVHRGVVVLRPTPV